MLVSNAPVVVPRFVRLFRTTLSTANSKSKSIKNESYQLNSKDKSSSHMSTKDHRRKKFQHPLSLPTKWGSDELIAQNQEEMGTGGRGDENKTATDHVSELTGADRRPSFEVDEFTGQSQHVTRIAGSSRVSESDEVRDDIIVTREWQVTTR